VSLRSANQSIESLRSISKEYERSLNDTQQMQQQLSQLRSENTKLKSTKSTRRDATRHDTMRLHSIVLLSYRSILWYTDAGLIHVNAQSCSLVLVNSKNRAGCHCTISRHRYGRDERPQAEDRRACWPQLCASCITTEARAGTSERVCVWGLTHSVPRTVSCSYNAIMSRINKSSPRRRTSSRSSTRSSKPTSTFSSNRKSTSRCSSKPTTRSRR